MKRILWSILRLTVVCMFFTVQCASGSNSISSFSVKSWNPTTSSWVGAADIFPREDVRLECTTTEFSQINELHIIRADGLSLSKNHTMDIQKVSQSLVVILKSVECSQMGTYLCQNGRGENRMADLGIFECPPQPCKDQSTNITLYVSVNKTTQFSVCVEAFPTLSSLALFNGKQVRFDRTNEIPGVNCTKTKLEEVFSTYHISCTITVGGEISYGVHNFSIPSGVSYDQIISFAVQLEKLGPPDCPTGIFSTNQGRHSVTLSWLSVNNRGGSQPVNYTIFYTTNDNEWQRYNTVEVTQVTITNLKTDIVYKFRVASANEYNQVIDENTCTDTVVFKTGTATTITSTTTITTPSPVITFKTSAEPDSEIEDAKDVHKPTPIVIAVIILAITVVVAVVVGLVVCLKIRSLNSQSRSTTLPSHAQLNSRHTQETTQQISLMDYTSKNRRHLRYQNVSIDEPIYETVT